MYIVDQQLNSIDVYHGGRGQEVQKKTWYQPFEKFLSTLTTKESLSSLQEERAFFLDERLFSFYRFDIRITSKKTFTIQDLKKLINKKLHDIYKRDSLSSSYVLHAVEHIMVDGKKSSFLLGNTGELSFSLQLCLLNQEGVALCSLMGGEKVFDHPKISFYPRNFFLLPKLTKQLKKEHCALLCIYEENTELIVVKKGRYHDIHYLNMGLQTLKSCYQEQDIDKYFYTDHKLVRQNPLLSKLVDEALMFFSENLCKWLQQYVPRSYDIVVVGDVVHNSSFLSVFQESYAVFGAGYIVPFIGSKNKKSKNIKNTVSPHIQAYQMMCKVC